MENFYLDIIAPDGARRQFALAQYDHLSIGRSPINHIVLIDPRIHPRHATLEKLDERWWVVDHHSYHGTRVNGIRIDRHLLGGGEQISIGLYQLIFVVASDETGED